MREDRAGRRTAQRPPDLDMDGRVGDVVVAAHDMRDAEFEVVDDGGEGVDRLAVGAQHDRIADMPALERHPAMHHVVPGDGLVRQPETPVRAPRRPSSARRSSSVRRSAARS